MPTPSWTVSFTMPTASNSPAKACAGHEANRTRRLDQPPSPVTQIHRPARLATRAASFRYGGRHHSGIPGYIIPLYPGGFVGIRTAMIWSSSSTKNGVVEAEAIDAARDLPNLLRRVGAGVARIRSQRVGWPVLKVHGGSKKVWVVEPLESAVACSNAVSENQAD